MKNTIFFKLAVAFAFVVMVVVNYLANALPIAGITTGEASDAYANLFAPAGLTFAIWGLIYLLLLAYTVYQFGAWEKGDDPGRIKLFNTVGRYFFISSLANAAWIFAWHYGILWLSVLLMLTLLYCLIRIADVVNRQRLSLSDNLLIRLPFSVYFGWITVATIANITIFLVSLGWQGFGLPESTWTILVLLTGAAIGITRMLYDKNIFYGVVLVWGYGGIWLKHTAAAGYDGAYPSVITIVLVCIVLFTGTIGFLAYLKLYSKN